jgi:putative component of membrane protein insertase Oxa1/YidC/SpoIIIJ protein YidD
MILKRMLKLIIHVYWEVIPEKNRKSCLFCESCSRYVYRTTEEKGFKEGIIALKQRYHQCRPGYKLKKTTVGWEMTLADGTILKNEEISKNLLEGAE